MDHGIQLLNQFTDNVEKKDEKAALKLKKEILELKLNDEAAVVAQYRMAFYILYREKKLDEAIEILKGISETKVRCDDYFQAAITYGICLWSKGNHPVAIFELRKVLSQAKPNSMHEVLALDYLSLFLRDSKAEAKQIAEVDEKRIKALNNIIKTEKDAETQATFRLDLAAAMLERGQTADTDQAKAIIKQVTDKAAKLSKTTVDAAKALLKNIKKPKKK